jgi:hydroxymethylglutaryl-CoA reductase
MRLHARQVAIAAGAQKDQVDLVVQRMVAEGVIRSDRAELILSEIRLEDKG